MESPFLFKTYYFPLENMFGLMPRAIANKREVCAIECHVELAKNKLLAETFPIKPRIKQITAKIIERSAILSFIQTSYLKYM